LVGRLPLKSRRTATTRGNISLGRESKDESRIELNLARFGDINSTAIAQPSSKQALIVACYPLLAPTQIPRGEVIKEKREMTKYLEN
jgi:hypothetical protein